MLARRVAALETALSPTELVLRWLEEAHAFGDLESYVRSLLIDAADGCDGETRSPGATQKGP